MRKKLIKIFLFSILAHLFSFNVALSSTFESFKWILKPSRPIQNEVFELTLSFNYVGKRKPKVSFELGGCELLKKSAKVVQKTNKIIKGKFISIKKMEFKYSFKTRSLGEFNINKLKINDGLIKKKIRKISFFVDEKIKKEPNYHFVGEVSKVNFFKGEGFDLNYFLYFKDYVLDTNVSKFPKLNGFFKRFKKSFNKKDEVHQYKGSVYNRRLIYSARLFPSDLGTFYIDGMEITVDIPKNTNNGFNSFLNSSRVKKIKLISPQVEINVKDIPNVLKGPGFINLVGNHKFSLNLIQNSNFVNDPIKLLLKVKGEGFLEEMDPPNLYQVKGINIFNIKTGFSLSQDKKIGVKEFTYTIIGKKKLSVDESKKLFSTFDSSTLSVNSQDIILPSLSFHQLGLKEKK